MHGMGGRVATPLLYTNFCGSQQRNLRNMFVYCIERWYSMKKAEVTYIAFIVIINWYGTWALGLM